MAKLGRYCKAYPSSTFQEFEGWNSKARLHEYDELDQPTTSEQATAAPQSHFYLQENFVVTRGIFIDEEIIYEDTGHEWIDFCKSVLKFEVPTF